MATDLQVINESVHQKSWALASGMFEAKMGQTALPMCRVITALIFSIRLSPCG